MTIKSLKYLSAAMLFAVSSCTYNQYTTTRGGYDEMYGGRYEEGAVVAAERSSQRVERNNNPDYQGARTEESEIIDHYYDENYVTARNIQRAQNSNAVGYNMGFSDGYLAGRNASFFGGMSPMWGWQPGINIGFRIGMGSMFSLGYSPFGWNRWNRWGGFYDPYWDAMAWGWGDPFMYGGGFGYPYYGFGGMGGMYGYNPYRWTNFYPVIVNNHYGDGGVRTRNYGPRTSGSAVSRTAAAGTSRGGGATTPTVQRSARSASSGRSVAAGDTYYSRPRTAVAGSSRASASNSSRVSTPNRGGASATNNNYYYANPGTNRGSYAAPSNARTRTSTPVYRSTEGGRSSITSPNSSNYRAPSRTNSGSYTAPSRSNSSSPSRSYSTPSRSYSTPSAPTRTYSAPSAPSRSYSAPSSGGGGRSSGGGGGRGPR